MIAAAAALSVANATKYATALFDPVVIALAVTAVHAKADMRQTVGRAIVMVAYLTTMFITLILVATLGNRYYLTGIMATTLSRAVGTTPPAVVLYDSWSWTQVLAVTALVGLVLSLSRRASKREKILR